MFMSFEADGPADVIFFPFALLYILMSFVRSASQRPNQHKAGNSLIYLIQLLLLEIPYRNTLAGVIECRVGIQ